MPRGLLLLALALGLTPLAAQITLTADYFPMPGDTLRTNLADSAFTSTVDVGQAGADQSWYFGYPTAADVRAEAVVAVAGNDTFPRATVLIQTNATTTSYYTSTEEVFELVGLESDLDLIAGLRIVQPVTPARAIRRAPLRYQDSFSSETRNRTTIAVDSIPEAAFEFIGDALDGFDSIRITTISLRNDVVDAWGTARLEDNFYPVLREARTETVDIRLEVKAGFLPWSDVTGIIALASPELAALLGPQPTTLTYYYWTPGSVEPVAEIVTLAADGSVQTMVYKRAQQSTSTTPIELRQAEMRVFPNPAADFTTFQVDGLRPGQYTLHLTNMLGRQLLQQEFRPFGDQTRLTLDVGHLPGGLYLVNLRNANGRSLGTKKLRVR